MKSSQPRMLSHPSPEPQLQAQTMDLAPLRPLTRVCPALFPGTDARSRSKASPGTIFSFLAVIGLAVIGFDTLQAQSMYFALPVAVGSGEGINNRGDIVGTLSANHHAFLFKRGRLTDLGVTPNPGPSNPNAVVIATDGFAVNDSDEVAGRIFGFSFGGTFPLDSFLYINGKMIDIAHGSNDGGFASSVGGINNAGEVIGSYDAGGTITNPPAAPTSATARAFLYRNGLMSDIGTLGGLNSVGSGINNAGQIVGISTPATNPGDRIPWLAYLYWNGQMHVIGGAQSAYFAPWAINDNGWITGIVTSFPTNFEVSNGVNTPPDRIISRSGNLGTGSAVLYVNGVLRSLGSLPGFTGSIGLSINNSGTVIGSLLTAAGSSGAFVYTDGRMFNLEKLIFGPWKILSVGHINDRGEIAATGIWPGSQATYALRLIPIRLPGFLR